MKTENAMQLKAKLSTKAEELGVYPQFMLQNYLTECFFARLAKSKYAEKFIVKGGTLVAQWVGLQNRATLDIDMTATQLKFDEENILRTFAEICEVDADDDFEFAVEKVSEIRENDDYGGFRMSLVARYEKMLSPLSVDVTCGDAIFPNAERRSFRKIFDDGEIALLSYPVESVLAEKIETILSRNVTTTRMRDFYDVYAIANSNVAIDFDDLRGALELTAQHRGSENSLQNAQKILVAICASQSLTEQWRIYTRKTPFAAKVNFSETLDALQNCLKNALEIQP